MDLFFHHFEIQLLALKCLKISSLKIFVDGVRFGLTKNVPAKTLVLANEVKMLWKPGRFLCKCRWPIFRSTKKSINSLISASKRVLNTRGNLTDISRFGGGCDGMGVRWGSLRESPARLWSFQVYRVYTKKAFVDRLWSNYEFQQHGWFATRDACMILVGLWLKSLIHFQDVTDSSWSAEVCCVILLPPCLFCHDVSDWRPASKRGSRARNWQRIIEIPMSREPKKTPAI